MLDKISNVGSEKTSDRVINSKTQSKQQHGENENDSEFDYRNVVKSMSRKGEENSVCLEKQPRLTRHARSKWFCGKNKNVESKQEQQPIHDDVNNNDNRRKHLGHFDEEEENVNERECIQWQ